MELPYGGILLSVAEPGRVKIILREISRGVPFVESVSDSDIRPDDLETCVFSLGENFISHFGLLRRGKQNSTTQRQVSVVEVVSLGSIHFGRFSKDVDVRRFLSEALRVPSSRATPAVWEKLLGTLVALCESQAEEILKLESIRRAGVHVVAPENFESIAQERDAVGLALEFFKLDRSKILPSLPLPGSPAPFLKSIPNAKLREDTMISHDAITIPEWDIVKRYQVGAVEFRRGNQRLTVVNSNRKSIEETLGVDLIYYHHEYDAYVLIQYKRMDYESASKWGFRPNEEQCMKELVRMQTFNQQHPDENLFDSLNNYRLNCGAFFYKLCWKMTYAPRSADLIQGIYIPLDYWESLIRSPLARGPRGGMLINSENVGRHLNNTQFISLVQQGWIGSRQQKSAEISNLIEQLLNEDDSVIYAASEDIAPPD